MASNQCVSGMLSKRLYKGTMSMTGGKFARKHGTIFPGAVFLGYDIFLFPVTG